MLPTINNFGEGLFVEKVSVWKQQIVVGDVVLAKSPRNPKDRIIKRVLGMEGDVVNVMKSSRRPDAEPVKVPAGYVWLQGDNTLNSTDSRDYGPVPYNLLMGRVLFRFFPLDRISWIERKVPAPFYG